MPAPTAPYRVAPGLFHAERADLGLTRAPGARTATVVRAAENGDHYRNGAALVAFRGRLYAQWQSSVRDEDSPDTWVAYSGSADGEIWSQPRVLAPASAGGALRSSGGWWTDGTMLVAFVNVWPSGFASGRGGHTEFCTSADGEHWSALQPVLDRDGQLVRGVIEQDIHAYDGRLHVAFHLQPGLIATPHFTDDPRGVAGWVAGAMPHHAFKPPTSRELEPSIFARDPGELVMVFRDQDSTHRQLAAVSRDRGATWTLPVPTEMPDARTKQSAGNLPDGTAFVVNCPSGTKERAPLAVTLGRDGRLFDRSFVLRSTADLPAQRFEGKFKRRGYHYPKSLVAGGFLYVIYATNKEDVEITRVPLATLAEE
ncbi:MAG: exo-alpha-sialidase [Opitutaceae bacterium]